MKIVGCGMVLLLAMSGKAFASPGRLLGQARVLGTFPGLDVRAMKTDAEGNVFVAGVTAASGLPTTEGALSRNYSGGTCRDVGPAHPCTDGYVAVLDAAGNVLFGSYIGGTGEESIAAMDAGGAGAIMLAGTTTSSGFPATAPALTNAGAGLKRSFLMRLAWRGGAALESSVILGDVLTVEPLAVALDRRGYVYVGGAASPKFPATEGAFQAVPGNDSHNGFLMRMGLDTTTVEYATYLAGASASDRVLRIAAGENGDVYVAGTAASADFPAVEGSYVNAAPQAASVFVARFQPATGSFAYIARLGGSGTETATALAVDASGNAYVAGNTNSDDFPVTAGGERQGVVNPFAAKLSADGSALAFSIFLGGEGYDTVSSILLEPEGTVALAGTAGSRLFRLTRDAHEGCKNAGSPTLSTGWLARLAGDGSQLLYASYFSAGAFDTSVHAAALDAEGRLTMAVSADPLDLTRYGGPVGTYVQPSEDHVIRLEPGEAPRTACVAHAASGATEAVTAGELVAIYGQGLGPAEEYFLDPEGGRFPTQAGGARVLFDGEAAPLLYAGPTQINAAAPASVAGKDRVTVEVEVGGEARAVMEKAVAEVVPGLFRTYTTRLAAAQNEDSSVNSRENPAASGSLVRLFATGDAALAAAGRDGEVAGAPGAELADSVQVQVGAQFAEVVHARQVEGGVVGLMEIVIRLPESFIVPAAEQNLVLYFGNAFTLGRITLAVKPQ